MRFLKIWPRDLGVKTCLALLLVAALDGAWLASRSSLAGRAAERPSPLAVIEQQSILSQPQFAARLLATAPADYRYNCHSWTFTKCAYDLTGTEVEGLLESGAYEPVFQPQVGDVVIYRNEYGDIMHSGRVRLTSGTGLILVESKWGTFGRYLHEPQTPRNATQFTYYRQMQDGTVPLLSSVDEQGITE